MQAPYTVPLAFSFELPPIPPGWQLPLIVTGIFTFLIFLGVLFAYLYRQKQRLVPLKKKLAKKTLIQVWKEFLKQIPAEFRSSVLAYPPVVVMGESGSGKSVLIGKYTDWKGQAAQFYPSYATDPTLQIYLGSRTLVQEIPSALLFDISQTARSALLKLWTPTFKHRDPVVVVTLSAGALRQATPDSLRTLAQTVRGKVNLISRIRNKPVKLRLVLTHMDQVEGYLAFSQFLEKQGVGLQLDIGPGGAEKLEDILAPYEKYLPLALTTLPAKAYMKVLTFLTKAPATFNYLAILLQTLREEDPLSHTPDIRELYLASDTQGSPTAISNPFSSEWGADRIRLDQGVKARHRAFAAAASILGICALSYSYARERTNFYQTDRELAQFEITKEPQHARAAFQRLSQWGDPSRRDLWARLPSPFAGRFETLRRRFVDGLRDTFVMPALERSQIAVNAHEATLFTVGLLYADRDNDLGKYILEHEVEWQKATGIPDYVVEAYVKESAAPYDKGPNVRKLAYEHQRSGANDLQPWVAYFIELNETLAKPYLTQAELAKLQAGAMRLLDSVAEVRRHASAQFAYRQVSRLPQFDAGDTFRAYIEDLTIPEWIAQNYGQAESLLEMIRTTDLTIPAVEDASLSELIYDYKGLAALGEKASGRSYRFQISDRVFAFDGAHWQKMIANGKIRLLVGSFVHGHRAGSDRTLFATSTPYPDIPMRPSTHGDYLFSGRGVLRGVYTRAAFDREVKPVLLQAASMLDGLASDPDLQHDLRVFVQSAVDRYAAEYDANARAFYSSFDVKAESLGGYIILLEEMRIPSSPLVEMLRTINETTGMTLTADEATSPFLRTITEKLAPFQFVNRLVTSEKDTVEIDKYREILARIENDLTAQASADAKKKDEPAKPGDPGVAPQEFDDTLKPAGRAAFAMLNRSRESYRLEVERWLDSGVGIVGMFRDPFLAPIDELYKLGLEDIEATISRNWHVRVLPQLTPILSKYPFAAGAEAEALPIEVESVLHPTGTFWRAFRNLVGPVCVEVNGKWSSKIPSNVGFHWPDNVFEVTNHVARLTAALWDAKGMPRAIPVQVMPWPLPAQEKDRDGNLLGRPILSFVNGGSSSVFGFNQRPAYQTLEWEWSKGEAASAGIQIVDAGDNKAYRQITVNGAESLWAFLHLLSRAQEFERNVWTFTVGGNGAPYTRVKFSYKEDPTALFRLPPFELSPEEMEAGAQVEASAKASAEKKMSPGGKSSTTPTSAKSSSALSGKGDKAGSLAEKEASAHGPKDNAALKEGTDAVKILK